MVAEVVTVEVVHGKRAEALDLAKRWAAAWPAKETMILSPETGPTARLMVIGFYDSLADREGKWREWENSPKYLAIVKELVETKPWSISSRVRNYYQVELKP